MRYFFFCLAVCILVISSFSLASAQAENPSDSASPAPPLTGLTTKKERVWYEKINLRGYAQLRYNRLFETNAQLQCEQCDRSWGGTGGFFFRRIRLIFSGNVHERVYIYIQPDLASDASGNNLHFAQIRDAYFDLALDKQREFRLRIGQSKVPYGFENMQSSQNRIPLDRNDALNSAVRNERDIGVMFYWAPARIRERFSYLVSSGLKGSGDYGVFGLGLYNGQTANRPELNNSPHVVGRLSYPFQFSNGQIIEPGLQAYTGEFVIAKHPQTKGPNQFRESRTAGTFVLYPQPFGIQAEYNVGRGPEFNPATLAVENQPLRGGYITASYLLQRGEQTIIPFFRTHYYKGGKKFEIDARRYLVNEQEIGVEWQPFANFEFVAMYTISDRTFEDYANPINRQKGRLLRLQAQFNY
jgi:hypothetical protein